VGSFVIDRLKSCRVPRKAPKNRYSIACFEKFSAEQVLNRVILR